MSEQRKPKAEAREPRAVRPITGEDLAPAIWKAHDVMPDDKKPAGCICDTEQGPYCRAHKPAEPSEELREKAREFAMCPTCKGSGSVTRKRLKTDCPECLDIGTRHLTIDDLAAFAQTIQQEAEKKIGELELDLEEASVKLSEAEDACRSQMNKLEAIASTYRDRERLVEKLLKAAEDYCCPECGSLIDLREAAAALRASQPSAEGSR